MAEPNQVAVRVGARGYRAEVAAGDHILVADEPVTLGGTNEGPMPYQYLAAALGACTAMTIRMYADRRGWPLDEVTVRLAHSRTHQKDCTECDTRAVGIDQFARSIELSGDLTDEQRAGLFASLIAVPWVRPSSAACASFLSSRSGLERDGPCPARTFRSIVGQWLPRRCSVHSFGNGRTSTGTRE